MKRAKRMVGLMLLLAALLGCLVFQASAADVTASGTCGGEGDGTNLTWTLDSEGTLTISGSGAMEDWKSYGSVPWYSNRSSIKQVIISDSVTTIGYEAFCNCDSLTTMTIGASVTTIGEGAFWSCDSLTTITVGASVTTIGDYAFVFCRSLIAVTIPDSVTTIGYCAFEDCDSLTTVTIGDSVTTIGRYAFDGCGSLTEITVSENNPSYSSEAGVLFDKEKATLIQYPIGNSRTSYEIPNTVTTIGEEAFYSCRSLTSVTIPGSVTIIDRSAFYSCTSLTTVTIPDSVTIIKSGTFSRCDSLTAVTIPDSVTTIGSNAFYSCDSLTAVTIPDSVTTIGDYAFEDCDSLTSVCFEGNAPSVVLAGTFDADIVTLYYIPGTTGWTDSSAYDASAGTWNGYKLAIWEERVPILDGEFTDNGGALVLDGIINIKRYFGFSEFDLTTDEIITNGGMLVWSEEDMPANAANAVYGTQSAISELTYEEATNEFSSKYEVNSWEYGKTFYFRPYVTNEGQYVYGDVVEYGVMNYCEGRFAKSSNAKLRSTLVALLNYGAAAQTYFGLNTDVPANAKMDQYIASYSDLAAYNKLGWKDSYLTAVKTASEDMTVNFTKTRNATDNGKSLVLKGAISLKLYTGVGTDASLFDDTCDAKYYFWTETDYAALEAAGKALTKKNASYVVDAEYAYSDKYGCEYSAVSEGIYAMYYGDTVYAAFCATDVDGTDYCSGIVTYSPETYAASKLGNGKTDTVDPVVQWMVVYGERAKAYNG